DMHRSGRLNDDSVAAGTLPVDVEPPQSHDIGRGGVDDDAGATACQNAGGPGGAGNGERKGDADRAKVADRGEVAGIEAVDLASRSGLASREGALEGPARRGAA